MAENSEAKTRRRRPMDIDTDKIDEMILALLFLVMHQESEWGGRA